MGKSERAKGVKAEQEVAAIFRAHGFQVARTPNSGGLHVKGDIAGVPGFHVEVKRQETFRLPLWRRQAASECGDDLPIVVFRKSLKPWWTTWRSRRDGEWYLATLDDWLAAYHTAPMIAGSSPEAAPSDREKEA